MTPGSWRLNTYNYFNFYVSNATEYINSQLNIYDAAAAATPAVVSTDAPVTRNLTYATGTVTIVLRTTAGTFSNPRIYAFCSEPNVSYWYTYAYGNGQNVTEAPVTFVGVKWTCTVTAYGRPDGGSGETSFGSITIDVVPGSDQTVDIGGPTLTVQSPAANAGFTSGPVTVTGKATDDQQVAQVTVNGQVATLTSTNNPGDPKEVSFSYSLALSPGANVIKTVATDSSGKSTSDTRTVYLDDQDPAVSWTPADGASFPVGQVVVSGTRPTTSASAASRSTAPSSIHRPARRRRPSGSRRR